MKNLFDSAQVDEVKARLESGEKDFPWKAVKGPAISDLFDPPSNVTQMAATDKLR